MRSLSSFYFLFTTLSTVGFGDYYPKSDVERLAGAFVLLSGVALFSYMMGEILFMINTLKNFDKEENDADLDKFFNLLSYFNDGKIFSLDQKSKIYKYLMIKWENDINKFLTCKED